MTVPVQGFLLLGISLQELHVDVISQVDLGELLTVYYLI